MPFDPDAYLAGKKQSFDPDAYLAETTKFDPDAYLQSEDIGETESALRGAAQGATLGFADEITGAAESLKDVLLTDAELSDIYDRYKIRRDESREAYRKAEEANPKSFLAGDVAGSLATMAVPGLNIAKGASAAGTIGKLGALGAAEGMGRTSKEDLAGIAEDTMIGAGLGAGLGAAGVGIGKGIKALKDKPKKLGDTGVDKVLGTLSTRIGKISPEIKGALRKFEFDTSTNTAKLTRKAEPFLSDLSAMPTELKQPLSQSLFNGKFDEAEKIMEMYSPKMRAEFDKTIKPMLDNLGDELVESGHSFEKLDNYFPRIVDDYDALRSTLGLEEQGLLMKQLNDFAKSKGTTVTGLDPEERAQIIEMALMGYRSVGKGKPKFAKQRAIAEVDENLLKHYKSPEEALAQYIRTATHDIQKRKFFGQHAAFDDVGKFDTDSSIGRLIDDGMMSGKIPTGKEKELFDMLQARFIGEKQGPSKSASTLRELGYMGTIANPISTITQLGDVGVAAGLKGLRNTIGALFNEKQLKTVDLGLDDVISKEFAGDGRKTVKLLNSLMGKSGFKAVDKLGKETFINAALRDARKQVGTDEGERIFREKVQGIMGKETDEFIRDLKGGKITENVKLWAFNQLADIQPIALSEMPEAYLRAKNGRLLYMLKSFTLKQLDVVRREVIEEYQKGNKKEAIRKAAMLGGYLTAANMGTQTIKDAMLGRDIRPEDVPDKALWSLLGAYGMNEYIFNRYLMQGKLVEGMAKYVTPATPVVDAAFTLGTELPKDDPKLEGALRGIPFVGPLVYSWFGGGAEKYNKRLREGERGGR